MNLARKHFQQHQAKSAAESAAEFGTMQNTTAYEQQLIQLNSDKNRIKNIQSKQHKAELKRELISKYKPYIAGILEVKPGVQDAVVTEMLVWAIDIAEYHFALDIAEYVLEHGLKLPDRFERSEACFIAEDISDEFLKSLKASDPIDITVLERLETLVTNEDLPKEQRDMPDEVKAKLYLALGKAEISLITGEEQVDFVHANHARDFLEQACKLDDKCGGRTDLNKVSKLVTKLDATFGSSQSETSGSTPEKTEQTDQVQYFTNPNGTPVVDDHGNVVPVSE